MNNNRKNPPKGHKCHVASRPPEKRFDNKPVVSTESNVKETSAAPPSSRPEAQVSFFVTKAQKAQLREKGYSDDQIAKMKPAEAHKTLGIGRRVTPARAAAIYQRHR